MTTKGKHRNVELKPLNVTCTSSNCDAGLHCFKKSRQMAEADRGKCRSCGADLVDWERVYKRNPTDAAFTFQSLKFEMVRHHFWHKPLDQKAVNHARRKGRIAFREATRQRLQQSIGPSQPSFDGRQTPPDGNVLYYAQHALACCCRKCLEYWHGIKMGTELTEEQINYLTELVMMYVAERLPDLQDYGEKVSPIRRQAVSQ